MRRSALLAALHLLLIWGSKTANFVQSAQCTHRMSTVLYVGNYLNPSMALSHG